MIRPVNALPMQAPMFASAQSPKVLQQASKRSGLSYQLQQMMGMNNQEASKPYVRILTPEQFEMLQDSSPGYVGGKKLSIDHNNQAAILIDPKIMTPTGMAWLEAEKLSYNEQTGLNIEISVKLPQGGCTADIGSPSLLVVVDKKWVDKGVTFNVKGQYPYL